MEELWLAKLKKCFKPRTLAYMSVIGAFLVQVTIGSIYTYGNMAPYIIDYLKKTQSNITVGNSMWIFGMAVFGLGSSMSLGGFIKNKIGTVPTVLLGCWIMSVGVFITYWTITVHLAFICISYGLIVGIGAGIAYGVSLSVPLECFPHAKGLVSGIIVSGFGIGPMVFDIVQVFYIHGNSTDLLQKDIRKLPKIFVILGSTYAVIQLLGAILITRPDKEEHLDCSSNEIRCRNMLSDELMPCNEVNISPHQLILELDFWILWLTFSMNSVVSILVIMLHKTFGQSMSLPDEKISYISAVGSLCNGAAQILWGYFNDRISYKILMSVLTLVTAVILGTFYISVKIIGINNQLIFYSIWCIMLHILISGNFTLFPTICVKTFGTKNFSENYGMLFTAYSFSGLLTSMLTTGLISKSDSDLYLAPFLIGCGLSLISFLITTFYRGRSLLYRNVLMSP